MAIPKAFCIELNKVVNIYDAHDAYFSQPEPRAKLSFLCPDKSCRDEKSPLLIGVNYTKNPTVDQIKNKPHFRAHHEFRHSLKCPWVEMQEARDELEKEEKKQARNLKNHEIVDVFEPILTSQDVKDEEDDGFLVQTDRIGLLPTKRARIESWKSLIKNRPHKTSRLDEVVTCFELLGDDEKKQVYLDIPDVGRKTYRQHFKSVRYARPDGEARIYYGVARVSLWEKKRYYINFLAKTEDNEFPDAEVSTYITVEQLSRFRGGALLRAQLELSRETKKHPCCYIFGVAETSQKAGNKLSIDYSSLSVFTIRLDTAAT